MEQTDRLKDLLADSVARARAEEVSARQVLERAQQATAAWTELQDYYSRGWQAHISLLLVRRASYFRGLENSDDERWKFLTEMFRNSQEDARKAVRRFPADFEQACEEAKLKLDSASRHPRYTVRNFIVIEVDENRLQTKITPRDGEQVEMPTDVKAIVQHLVKEDKRLFGREFDGARFLRSLFTAYQAALKGDEQAGVPRRMGEEIPLRRVTHRMSKNLTRFASDEFNIDLATAVRENELTIEGYQLHLAHTRNTRQGMLLYGMEGSGYVGFISFRKA